MKPSNPSCVPLALALVLAITACDDDPGPSEPGEAQYSVLPLPSLGGTSSSGNGINDSGWVVGYSDLGGDSIRHAALWIDGAITDLGTLGGPNSNVAWPGQSNNGMVVGISETAELDTLGQSFSCWAFFPSATGHQCQGFLWEDGQMTALPAFNGQNSFATGVNSQGHVVGWAETWVEDPTCTAPNQVLQFRAALWVPAEHRIKMLPPLPGDPVSAATAINDQDQVVGISGACGIAVGGVSARRAVLWEDGEPMDLGHLGADTWNTPMDINEAGEVVGFAGMPTADGVELHAFMWTEAGGIQALGTLPGDVSSQALGINASGQVVGLSSGPGGSTAVLWQDGEPVDLNTLVAPGFDGRLRNAGYINDDGVIAGSAEDADGNVVTYVAMPVAG